MQNEATFWQTVLTPAVLLTVLICLVLAAAGVFFITRMALGSAPLPAGFGA